MDRRVGAIIFAVFPLLVGLPAAAHERFHIVGTVAEQHPTSVLIRTNDGRIVSVSLDVITRFYRNDEKLAATELKPGTSVAVDAIGDSEEDLMALEVTIAPATGSSRR